MLIYKRLIESNVFISLRLIYVYKIFLFIFNFLDIINGMHIFGINLAVSSAIYETINVDCSRVIVIYEDILCITSFTLLYN